VCRTEEPVTGNVSVQVLFSEIPEEQPDYVCIEVKTPSKSIFRQPCVSSSFSDFPEIEVSVDNEELRFEFYPGFGDVNIVSVNAKILIYYSFYG
jgi:hypothetical protein